MATSKITAPDGTVYQVTHPDNATDEEILAKVRSESQAAPADAFADPSLSEKREQVGGGGTFQFGLPGVTPVWDSGLSMPQGLTEALAGMGRRFTEIGTLGTHQTPPEAAQLLDDSGYAMAGGAMADLSTLAAGGSALRGIGLGGTLGAKALTNPQSLLQAATGGAAYGAATSPDRVTGAFSGGIGGGVGYGIPAAIGRAVSPNISAPAREMIDSGATLTPGEMLGGTTKRFEDAATSIPVLGDAIKGAQRRSLAQYSRNIVDETLSPIGKSLDESVAAGSDAIGQAQKVISNEFDDVLGGMNVRLDQQFADEVTSLRSLVSELPEKEAKEFDRILQRDIVNRFDNENQLLLGRTFKEADTAIRESYQSLMNSGDHYQRQLGNALRTMHESLLDLGRRQNPDLAPRLDAAKKSYAMMQRVNDAANYVGAQDRIFTPSHMLNSIKRNTDKSRFARGEGFDQAKTEAAKGMLAQTIPDSGTTTRALINAATLGGGAVISPASIAGLLGGAGIYTKPGGRLAQAALASRPESAAYIRKLLEESAPYMGLLGTGAGLNAE